ASIVLTVRDAASWYRSSMATVWADRPTGRTDTPGAGERAARLRAATLREVGLNVLEDPNNEPLTTSLFDRYSAQVKQDIPPERLLVFDVAQGWEPLCKFLRVPAPQTPFPRENAAEDFQHRFGPLARPG